MFARGIKMELDKIITYVGTTIIIICIVFIFYIDFVNNNNFNKINNISIYDAEFNCNVTCFCDDNKIRYLNKTYKIGDTLKSKRIIILNETDYVRAECVIYNNSCEVSKYIKRNIDVV